MPVLRSALGLPLKRLAKTNPLPKPGMLYHAQAVATANPDLKLLTAQAQHKKFVDTYRLLPQSLDELNELMHGDVSKKVLLTKPIESGTLQSFAFNYVGMINGIPFPQENVYTDIYKGNGVGKVFWPSEYSPTCDRTVLPNYLEENNLRELKKAGIDILVFVTPGKQDSLCRWVRDALHEKGLDSLMPDVLPVDDVDARITLNRSMPTIIAQACPGLEDINAHGLILGKNRLGITSQRAYAIYDKEGVLRLLVMAQNPSLQMCAPTLANAMLKEVQKLNLNGPVSRQMLNLTRAP